MLFGAVRLKKVFNPRQKNRCRLCSFQFSRELVPCSGVPHWGPGWSGSDWLESICDVVCRLSEWCPVDEKTQVRGSTLMVHCNQPSASY